MKKLVLEVIVKPNSSKESLKEISPKVFEVKVKDPPIEGKANKKLIELLAKHFRVPKSNVRIRRGTSSRRKLIEIELLE